MPLVMVLVAAVHLVRVVAYDQSTWQGAGFGMFATYEADHTRQVAAWAVVDGRPAALSTDDVDDDLLRRARVTPRASTLQEIGAGLVETAPADTTEVVVEVRGPDLRRDRVVLRTIARARIVP